jgi:ligand-binding sensor domain-containing protein
MRALVVLLLGLWTATASAAVHTSTANVTGVARDPMHPHLVWASTTGGVETYDLRTGKRLRLITTDQGLPSNEVLAISFDHGGGPTARTRGHRCFFGLDPDRPTCEPAPMPELPLPVAGRHAGARITVTDGDLVGTAGAGLFHRGVRLTPAGQICTNHVDSMVQWRGQVWLGGFDRGLCRFDGQRFHTVTVPFRMVNDLLVTRRGLLVAASEGLFHSADGVRFARVTGVVDRGFNGLALEGRDLALATTPGGLFEIDLSRRGPRLAATRWRPGGARAVQAVATGPRGERWLASEDHGALRVDLAAPAIYDRASGLPASWLLDLALTEGGLLLASLRDGLVRVDLATGASQVVAGSSGLWLLSVTPDTAGLAWVGSQQGLWLYAGGVVLPVALPLPNPCVHAVLRVGEHLWIATEGGLAIHRVP